MSDTIIQVSVVMMQLGLFGLHMAGGEEGARGMKISLSQASTHQMAAVR